MTTTRIDEVASNAELKHKRLWPRLVVGLVLVAVTVIVGRSLSQPERLLPVGTQAKRVTYKFRPGIAALVDDVGREQGISPLGQAAIDRLRGGPDPLASPLPAGFSATTDVGV